MHAEPCGCHISYQFLHSQWPQHLAAWQWTSPNMCGRRPGWLTGTLAELLAGCREGCWPGLWSSQGSTQGYLLPSSLTWLLAGLRPLWAVGWRLQHLATWVLPLGGSQGTAVFPLRHRRGGRTEVSPVVTCPQKWTPSLSSILVIGTESGGPAIFKGWGVVLSTAT